MSDITLDDETVDHIAACALRSWWKLAVEDDSTHPDDIRKCALIMFSINTLLEFIGQPPQEKES